MIRLHQMGGKHDGRSLSFDKGPVRIGRLPESELALDAFGDLDVSGRHAELLCDPSGRWLVADQASRNGTYVNGNRIGRHYLAPGDTIQLGPEGPKFRVEFGPSDSAPINEAAIGTGPTLLATPAEGHAPMASPHAATGMSTPAPTPPQASPASQNPPQSPFPPSASAPIEHARWAPPGTAPAAATPTRAPVTSPPPSTPLPFGAVPPTPPMGQAPSRVAPPERTVGDVLGAAGVSAGWKAAIVGLSVALLLAIVGVAVLIARRSGPVPDASQIAAANRATLVDLATTSAGQTQPFCTAIAVRASTLATSARCVLEVEARQRSGVFVEVVQGVDRFPITRLWRHPDFDAASGVGPDVGLIECSRPLPLIANVAEGADSGDRLVGMGPMPAGLVATPVQVEDSNDVTFRYPLLLPPGSPLFDATGALVGIHSGIDGELGRATHAAHLSALLEGLGE